MTADLFVAEREAGLWHKSRRDSPDATRCKTPITVRLQVPVINEAIFAAEYRVCAHCLPGQGVRTHRRDCVSCGQRYDYDVVRDDAKCGRCS